METTQIPFTDIILKIGEPTRDIVERYIIDFIMDEGDRINLNHTNYSAAYEEFYVTIDLYLTSLKVIDNIITDGNQLDIEITEYERTVDYLEEVANYINESRVVSDAIIYEIFNTVRKKKNLEDNKN